MGRAYERQGQLHPRMACGREGKLSQRVQACQGPLDCRYAHSNSTVQ